MNALLRIGMLLIITAAFGMQTQLRAGDKKDKDGEKKTEKNDNITIEAELNNADLKDKVLTQSYCKTYTYKMTQGRTYQIDMISKAFDAFLRLEDPKGTQVAQDDDSGGMLNSRIIYKPTVTGDFTICAMSLGGGSTGKFTLLVKEKDAPAAIELKNDKGSGSATAKLDANDPLYKGKKHKSYLFNMEAGKTYQIDMTSKNFDSYLYLEDVDGKLVAEDDDNGGNLNARIRYKANANGKHRIITTYFADGGNLGEFTLTIRQNDDK